MRYLTLEKAMEAWRQLQPLSEDDKAKLSRLFYQVFTRETGLTPSQWRDSQGGEVNG